jgi:hypothetical protein
MSGGSMDLKKDIEDLQDGEYETGWAIFNRFRTKRVVSKAELIQAKHVLGVELGRLKELNREVTVSDFHDEHIRERLEREEELVIAVHMLQVATTQGAILDVQAKAYLTRSAAEKGLTVETDQEIKKVTLLEEHKVEMEFRKAMNTLAAISKFKHLQYEAFDEIRGRLNSLIIDQHQIQQSDLPEQVKRDQIEIVQNAIEAYKAVFNAQRNRLVEAGYGDEMEGIGNINTFDGDSRGGGRTAAQKLITVARPGEESEW